MSATLTARIAARFLTARKRRRSVGIVSAVAVCGVAVATAALVCVLSVYNGFDSLLGSQLSHLSPPIAVTPASGKTIPDAEAALRRIRAIRGVKEAAPEVSDNALAIAGNRQYPVTVRGVEPEAFATMMPVRSLVTAGRYDLSPLSADDPDAEFDFESGGAAEPSGAADVGALLSIGVASSLGIESDAEAVGIYAPRRLGRISVADPARAFTSTSVMPRGVFRSNQKDFDTDVVIVPIATARALFQYEREATSIDVSLTPEADAGRVAREIEKALPGTTARDRLQQHSINFRMVKIEKWITFLLLFFILVIASFNVISAVSMLVLEKRHSLRTLRNLGLTLRRTGRIFLLDSAWIVAAGGAAGIALGVALCLLQQHFGLLRLNANPDALTITAYPVELHATDLAAIAAALTVIALITGLVSARYARRTAA